MGADPYMYTVAYRADTAAALNELREREFRAGRYNPVMVNVPFPVTEGSPAPGPRHRSIDDAIEAADADGTRSILDIERIADEPENGAATPLAAEVMLELYETTEPTVAQVEGEHEVFEYLERGQAVYIVCYEAGTPTHLVFAGYSYD
jgi:hypothetical protein